jgi:hypothetical protein
MMMLMAAILGAALAACSPSPERLQPADPLGGMPDVQVHIGGCSPAVFSCP